MLLSHVLFRPFSRIDPPDTVGHSSPTLPFSIHHLPLLAAYHSEPFKPICQTKTCHCRSVYPERR
jgi:hypothetical protein